jgi:hypothetical protein
MVTIFSELKTELQRNSRVKKPSRRIYGMKQAKYVINSLLQAQGYEHSLKKQTVLLSGLDHFESYFDLN